MSQVTKDRENHAIKKIIYFFFLWRYSPNLGLGLPPWNYPLHFGLLNLRHPIGLLGRVISSSQGLYLYTNKEKRTYTHKHQTSMSWVGFEPTIPAFERSKTVHALDRSTTVTDPKKITCRRKISNYWIILLRSHSLKVYFLKSVKSAYKANSKTFPHQPCRAKCRPSDSTLWLTYAKIGTKPHF
jgi:hypothetical protein